MYTLLTGATGMLGRYLLRDLLLRGCNIAVLVRPNRRDSAADRVDAVLSYWESAWNRTLPRPVVLSGDIVKAGLGLSSSDQRWLAANCQSVIHSAASLTFYEDDGEPWRSNVQGLRHVLDVCRELSIRRLYHVSTAYTCGQRNDTIYEDELDVGQEFGNDYERSKVQAEELIRQSTCLDVAAIFRPSIIVGDSVTGFSSTFHGFYTPLRLAFAIQSQLGHEQLFEHDFMALMGLAGDETKNFVPVDWVSQAIVSIIERRPADSQTYALVSMSPVKTAQLMNVIRAVSEKHGSQRVAPTRLSSVSSDDLLSDPIVKAYLQQLHTYQSYWRNDPVFDCANTTAALPDLPCPLLTDDLLFRLAEWAAVSKFTIPVGTKNQKAPPLWLQADRDQQSAPFKDELERVRVLTVTGQGGGSWTLDAQESGPCRVCDGRLEGAPEMGISRKALERVVAQETTLDDLLQAGDLVTVGRACDLASWQRLLDRFVHSRAVTSSGGVNVNCSENPW